MNLLTLQYFCAIARYGNMTRAAETLHISQPALSKMLHQLEQEVGQPLFHRLPSGLQLTESGGVLSESLRRAGADPVRYYGTAGRWRACSGAEGILLY